MARPHVQRIGNRIGTGERGFTLAEVLVVMLIIGVLAAIALPMFLGQQDKGHDAAAKSDARNLMTQVDSCYEPTEDFRQCNTAADLGNTGVDWGTGPGQASVVSAQKDSWVITAVSKTTTGGQNDTFTITRAASGLTTRSCTAGAGTTGGGCRNGSW